jgi:hypothetical protein
MTKASAFAILSLLLFVTSAIAAAPGKIALDVMGENGAGAKLPANVIASDGKVVATVAAGSSVEVAPGEYRLELPIIGGSIVKNSVSVESGRTHTVVVDDVGVLEVSVKDKTGHDPGFQVTVNSSTPPHPRIASFLSGDRMLFAPTQVDVHVDAPPQGYDWHAVAVAPGHRARLTLDQVVQAELDVQAEMAKLAINEAARVVIYRAGTQIQVAVSDPGRDHVFKLDPGEYDVYVENRSGKGKSYATSGPVHLESGARVERVVPMD